MVANRFEHLAPHASLESGLHLTSRSGRIDLRAGMMFQSGQLVRVNLAGLQAEGVMFQAAVTDAVGHIVKQTSEQPET